MKKRNNLLIITLFSCLLFILSTTKVQAISYKLVNFNTKGNANTNYIEDETGKSGYINGSVAADGIYLGEKDGKVKFKISGVVGWVNSGDVKLVDMSTSASYDKYKTSSYKVVDGNIRHYISGNVYSSKFSSMAIGPNNIGLSNNKFYLSYDGHYFYQESLQGYKDMTDDYVNNVHTHAVNKDNPYYSYYVYLSHRSKTNYTAKDLANYFKTLGYTAKPTSTANLTSNQSQLYGEENNFINAQNTYGVNALMMLGVAINESGWGRSNISINKNNLFGHSAYDVNPGTSANKYSSVAQSIKYHAKGFISEGYMDPKDYSGRYNGGHLGTKTSGVNIKYASDPYWGEKAASNYYSFDKMYGLQDYGTKTLGIKTGHANYNIYKEPNTNSTALYKTGTNNDYSVIILDEVNGQSINGNTKWYKIQADPTITSNRNGLVQDNGNYNFDNNYAYIHSSNINLLLKNGQVVVDKNFEINFNANGGKFDDNSTNKKVVVSQGTTPSVTNPTREGYTFNGWDKNVTSATANTTYNAVWTKNKYNVTVEANGGVFSDNTALKVISVEYGNTPNIETPTREGYKFTGWDKNITPVTTNITYKAKWEQVKTYEIKFDADGGVFSNNKETVTITVNEDDIPNVEMPTKDNHVFTGWTPTLQKASENTTYKAIWREGTIEDYRTLKDGDFYLDYLKEIDGKLMIRGFQTLEGLDNNLTTDIQYMIAYENLDNNKIVYQTIDRIKNRNDITKVPYSPDGKDYTYSWYDGNIDTSILKNGNYRMYLYAYNDKYYSKSTVCNRLYKTQATSFKDKNKGIIINNNFDTRMSFVELKVRNKLLAKKSGSYVYNQNGKYTKFNFENNKLHLRGHSYSYGMNLSPSSNVSRSIIFENKDTYETYTKTLGSITKGDYKLVLPEFDNLDKTRAWYDAKLDLSDIPKGEYVIYITTTSNITDIFEMTEGLSRSLSDVKATIDGKEYAFIINYKRGGRIEMIVK